MNKKIIAAALALIFVATAFTACKKEIETMKIYGNEYPVYRDENGELVYNENNEIAILVTDRQNNEVVTEKGGEPQTYWLQMDKDVVHDGYVQGSNYKLTVPSGWEGNEYGKVEKKKTDGKCYIEFKYLAKVEKDETLEDKLKQQDEYNETIAAVLKDEAKMNQLIAENPDQADAFKAYVGSNFTYEKNTATITKDSLNCEVRIVKIVDASGKLVQYAEDYYFISDGKLYMVKYTCLEGEGYDSSFNFAQYLADGFTFKPEKK